MLAVGASQRRKAFQLACGRASERASQQSTDGRRAKREFFRRTGADTFAEIILTRFVRDLMNGGMIKGRGKIGQVALFLGQFDDAEQPVAEDGGISFGRDWPGPSGCGDAKASAVAQ